MGSRLRGNDGGGWVPASAGTTGTRDGYGGLSAIMWTVGNAGRASLARPYWDVLVVREMEGATADTPVLLDGESLVSILPSGGRRSSVVLLTNRRVIGLSGKGRQREASYASIGNVSSVHLSYEQEGRGNLGWAVLGLVVAVLLFATIDNPIGKLVAPAAAAAISIYLIVDRFTVPGRRVLSFRTGASEVRCELPDRLDSSQVYEFVNRMYELRDGAVRDHASSFAPR